MSRRPRSTGVGWVLTVAVVGALAGCSSGHPSAAPSSPPVAVTGPGSPTGSGSPGSGSPGSGSPGSGSPGSGSPGASGTATTGSNSALVGLPYVPSGFTLPPGAVVQSHDIVGTQTEVVLTAPPATVAVAYLRQEITGLGYGQRGQRSSGGITAYAYRLGSSVLSVSGGSAGGSDVTALVFENG